MSVPEILHGLAAWGRILTREIEEIEKMQTKALKQLLQVPISTLTAGVLMDTGIWPAKGYLQYSIAKERIAKIIVKEQRKYNLQQIFYSRVNSISEETGADINAADNSKSAWKKLIKQKINGIIQKRLGGEMGQKQNQEQLKIINEKGKYT